MDRFVRLSGDERRRYFVQTAERMRLSPQIIEKDFWVCWTLRELFALPNIGSMLIALQSPEMSADQAKEDAPHL